MSTKSTISGFIVRSILIAGMAFIIIRSGQIVGRQFLLFDIPYAGEMGFALGAAFVFAIFVVLHRGYSAYRNDEVGE